MTAGLPGSGQLSLNDIQIEILKPSGNQIDMNNAQVRDLCGVYSGTIAISNAYGKRWVTPGAADYYFTGGWQYLSVPRYQFLTIQVWGAGGGGSGGCGNDGFAYGYCGGNGGGGGTTTAYNLGAGGGGGGFPCNGYGGNGCGYGGSYNICGGGYGGGGPGWGSWCGGGSGGTGGYASRTYNWFDGDAPAYYSTISIYVGGGGGGGGGAENAGGGGSGSGGRCYINWS